MARPKSTKTLSMPAEPERPPRVPTTPEEAEAVNIGLAVDLASKQLKEGTVSAQVQVHYLKLGTAQHRLELRKLEGEIELQKARVSAIESAAQMAQMFEDAIKAMVEYGGGDVESVQLEDMYKPDAVPE